NRFRGDRYMASGYKPPRRRDEAVRTLSKLASAPARQSRTGSEVVMSNYCYEAVDAGGLKTRGSLDVSDQHEALRRIKEMGLFPTRVAEAMPFRRKPRRTFTISQKSRIPFWRRPHGRIK